MNIRSHLYCLTIMTHRLMTLQKPSLKIVKKIEWNGNDGIFMEYFERYL